jgi:transcriptional regulator with XRE-family HTH domain
MVSFNDLGKILKTVGVNMAPKEDFDDFFEIVGENLRNARLAKKLDLETAAAAAGLSPDNLELLENGLYNFELQKLVELCAYYKISFKGIGRRKNKRKPASPGKKKR